MAFQKYTKILNHRLRNRTNNRIFSNFANRVGLVYFGFVNQHKDEHKIIRGLTLSPTITDNNYCVGTVDNYNVSVVDRSDYLTEPDGKDSLNNWIIFTFDLHSSTAIPHFFIGAKNQSLQPYHSLFSTFPNMKKVNLDIFDKYSADFSSRFDVYSRPAKSIEIQIIISVKLSDVLAAHFWPICIEQHNNVLYLYLSKESVSTHILDNMLKNGLWLASQLDMQFEHND
jgi:hypothetical protein